jgi:hypothetical protein
MTTAPEVAVPTFEAAAIAGGMDVGVFAAGVPLLDLAAATTLLVLAVVDASVA